jgi:transposase
MHKLGEDVTETLELVPHQWKVIQHVRKKYSCRSFEKITQPRAPSDSIARGRAGPRSGGSAADAAVFARIVSKVWRE